MSDIDTTELNDGPPKCCERLKSRQLNADKAEALVLVIAAYANEKDDCLRALTPEVFTSVQGHRSCRDHLLAEECGSPHRLQARMCKQALADACETLTKFWTSVAEELRPLVIRKKAWTDEMRHYAFWLLFSPKRVAAPYAGQTPIPTLFEIAKHERSADRKSIAREVRKHIQRLPRVKQARSACFDANMYTLATTHSGHQPVELMGLKTWTRIRVPLLADSAISGNIRGVIEPGARERELHTTFDLRVPNPLPDAETLAWTSAKPKSPPTITATTTGRASARSSPRHPKWTSTRDANGGSCMRYEERHLLGATEQRQLTSRSTISGSRRWTGEGRRTKLSVLVG
ncbi:MAG: hypothetical protein ACYDEY_02680 [Acidimicrobiales bacterium]